MTHLITLGSPKLEPTTPQNLNKKTQVLGRSYGLNLIIIITHYLQQNYLE